MKTNGTHINNLKTAMAGFDEIVDQIGDNHAFYNTETPIRKNAFDMDAHEKISIISRHFKSIMETLGLDLQDDSLKGTPKRVAKMFVNELFYGLDPKNKPAITLFENAYKYRGMVVEKNINLHSYCEHHFVPIIGKAHVAYIPGDKVVGLSKLNRIVQYYAKRPQVQERLTNQIAEELKMMLGTNDVAVVIDSAHMCISMRGVQDQESTTFTSYFSGRFQESGLKNEFLSYINTK